MGRAKSNTLTRRKNLVHARSFISDPICKLNTYQYAFSIVTNGANNAVVDKVLLWNNIMPPPHTSFSRAMKVICQKIEIMAIKSAEKMKSRIGPNSAISFDGAWVHRRNSFQCVGEFVDSKTQKIIGFNFQEKTEKENINIAANGLEIACLQSLIDDFKYNQNIKFFIHDNDGKAVSKLRENGWNLEEKLDPNHSSINFERRFDTFNDSVNREFTPLKSHLSKFLKLLQHSDMGETDKIKFWKNSIKHFLGEHEQCPFKHQNPTRTFLKLKDLRLQELLNSFLDDSIIFIKKCDKSMHTQTNEAFHALKAHFLNKLYSWKLSWKARICAAILDINENPGWRFALYNELKLPPLCQAVKLKLMKIYSDQINQKLKRRTEEYKNKERLRRQLKKERNKGQLLTLAYDHKDSIMKIVDIELLKLKNGTFPVTSAEKAAVECKLLAKKFSKLISKPPTNFPKQLATCLAKLIHCKDFNSFAMQYKLELLYNYFEFKINIVAAEIIHEELSLIGLPQDLSDELVKVLIESHFSINILKESGIISDSFNINISPIDWFSKSKLLESQNLPLWYIPQYKPFLELQDNISFIASNKHKSIEWEQSLSIIELSRNSIKIICSIIQGAVILLIEKGENDEEIIEKTGLTRKQFNDTISILSCQSNKIIAKTNAGNHAVTSNEALLPKTVFKIKTRIRDNILKFQNSEEKAVRETISRNTIIEARIINIMKDKVPRDFSKLYRILEKCLKIPLNRDEINRALEIMINRGFLRKKKKLFVYIE